MSSKRANGEGSIIQIRKDGKRIDRWQARATIDVGGTRKRAAFYGRTRAEAHEKLAAALANARRGIAPASLRLTVGAYLTDWLDGVAVRVRPTTARHYRLQVRTVIDELGATPLTRLTAADVQRLLRRRGDAGLSPQSVAHIRTVLRTALSDAVKRDLVARNVAALTDAPRVESHKPEPIDAGEARRLLAAAEGTSLVGVMTLAVGCGLRLGEILGLRWTDIHDATGTVLVRAALQRVDGRYVLSEPKTGRSRRTLPLPPGVARVLRARRAEQSAERLAAGTEWSEPIPGLVFTTAFGAPRCPTALTHTFARLLQRHGFAPRTFHGLRHAHATLALSSGVDLKTLSAMLGHSSIRLTADTYADVLPSMSRDAAARMDAVLTG